MRYGQLIILLNESGLSPERLSSRLHISNLTYRRWPKRPKQDEIPKSYDRAIAGGIYQLLSEGQLRHDSKAVATFMESNLPEFFAAATEQFNLPADLLSNRVIAHQDKMAMVLSHIGNNDGIRRRVDGGAALIQKFTLWGAEWKDRITLLQRVVRDKKLSLVDKLVAYGAFFYLILPMDLIPDSVPVFGYVDDFGVLGFAAAYYIKKYPDLAAKRPARTKTSK
jgi:uncharacterized membrane protein YkvA (DUF1232 family)